MTEQHAELTPAQILANLDQQPLSHIIPNRPELEAWLIGFNPVLGTGDGFTPESKTAHLPPKILEKLSYYGFLPLTLATPDPDHRLHHGFFHLESNSLFAPVMIHAIRDCFSFDDSKFSPFSARRNSAIQYQGWKIFSCQHSLHLQTGPISTFIEQHPSLQTSTPQTGEFFWPPRLQEFWSRQSGDNRVAQAFLPTAQLTRLLAETLPREAIL